MRAALSGCQPCGCEVECPVGLVCVCVAADASSGIVLNLSECSCRRSGGRVSPGEAKSSFNEFSRGGTGNAEDKLCENV